MVPPATVTIALCQEAGATGDVTANLACMSRAVHRAADLGCGLILFPEMFLTGYNVGDALTRLAQPWDGPAANRASRLARESGVAILYGYPEKAEKCIYNSALYVSPDGEVRGNYRKTHLYGPEKMHFNPGNELLLVKLGPLAVGILICYDVEFHGAVTALVNAGAHLIAVPTALMEPYCHVARIVVPARAYESQVYIAYANRCGREGNLHYCGSSCVVGPDGHDVVRADRTSPELITARIDLHGIVRVRKQDPLVGDRRPELYAKPIRNAG